MRIGRVIAVGMLLAAGGCVTAPLPAPDPTVQHADYSNPALWLCRPDLADNKCHVDLTATLVPADGKMSIEKYVPAKAPEIDCFFVYPTVSMDPGYQSDFSPDAYEFNDVKQQFARFGSVCRQFAPLYRQTTVTVLRAPAGGPQPVGERPPQGFGGYTDVLDAWNYYLQHENKGRGVVLVGHSQGSQQISRLIRDAIEGKPEQKLLVSALILGVPVLVPEGKDVGGTFKSVPLCRAEDQVGCVISYATYRDRYPPQADARFGKSRDGMLAACNNPANLATGTGQPDSYFLAKGVLNNAGGDGQTVWVKPGKDVTTPFVRTPGLVTTTCVRKGDYTYLELHVNAVPEDPRTDDILGEIIRAAGPDYSWGLHMLDMDHSIGDLMRIVSKQGRAFATAKAN